MRLWTAINGWAALIAVSLALAATGSALNTHQAGSGDWLIHLAVGFACVATAIFLGDLVLLWRREVRRRSVRSTKEPQFGRLDFGPEFERAVVQYSVLQNAISEKSQAAAAVAKANTPLAGQVGASNVAAALADLTDTMNTNIPLMNEQSLAIRVCLFGILRESASRTDLDTLHKTATTAIKGIEGFKDSLGPIRTVMQNLRKQNTAKSINDAIDGYLKQLGQYKKVAKRSVKMFHTAERRITWRLRLGIGITKTVSSG